MSVERSESKPLLSFREYIGVIRPILTCPVRLVSTRNVITLYNKSRLSGHSICGFEEIIVSLSTLGGHCSLHETVGIFSMLLSMSSFICVLKVEWYFLQRLSTASYCQLIFRRCSPIGDTLSLVKYVVAPKGALPRVLGKCFGSDKLC